MVTDEIKNAKAGVSFIRPRANYRLTMQFILGVEYSIPVGKQSISWESVSRRPLSQTIASVVSIAPSSRSGGGGSTSCPRSEGQVRSELVKHVAAFVRVALISEGKRWRGAK
ncbi:hypothetical protein AVEN_162530-1 [Araneus ventricosus]|uniref:Uncharacterized protein n=1 Tax=Araneus ventricosus TaxID=182803 RepID=A0A4Y2I5G7_ARAVE|nr:hypothetical protein AVEN_162530-1 [Araneus ventricosus]